MLRIAWTPSAKAQFEAARQRAVETGQYEHFRQVHNEIVLALRAPTTAIDKGELLYETRMAGGQVRHWVRKFISVCYAVRPADNVGWITRYQLVPETWPEN